MTQVIPLNDNWSYDGMTVDIPHSVSITPYNCFDESVYQKVSEYRKTLHIPPEYRGRRVFLKFDGVAHEATVYVNSEELFCHRCGYTAFEVEITDNVRYGEDNELLVSVDSRESLDIPPFGYVIDYMTYGGIYREVSLIVREQNFISDVYARAGGDLKLKVDISFSQNDDEYDLFLKRTDGDVTVFKANNIRGSFSSDKIGGIEQWSVDHPVLYDLTVKSRNDSKTVRIGFRDSEFRKDGYYLNGKKLRIRGLNRHQSYPYVGYAMPKSMQRLDADILKFELGVNAVRTSHYPQSQHFIDRCDEIGLLVFTEIPGWQHIGGDEWKETAVKNVEEMVMQYRNHPSVILWGVRINESIDDDEFYRKTNDTARRLDPGRPTGGVRYLKKSSLLEDVYTYNDFLHSGRNPGCDPKKKVTSDIDKPYLISEYNGHMYPTKPFDDEQHRTEHAIRHANVLDAVAGADDIAGSFGWCMFDYNTHKDFGSGDRICYHGVMDMFRNPKQAAYVYSASGDIAEPFLEISSSFDIGEHAAGNRGSIYIYTNCDSVKMYKNDKFIKEYTHKDTPYRHLHNAPILIDDYIGDQMKETEGFSDRQNMIVREALNHLGQYGMDNIPPKITARLVEAMAVYHMKFEDAYALYQKYIGNWGGSSTEFRFEGIRDGRTVITRTKSTFRKLRIEAGISSHVLREEDTYDAALIRIRITDEHGNIMTYFNGELDVRIRGDIGVIGPSRARISGGMGGMYVRSVGIPGRASVTIRAPEGYDMDDVKIDIDIEGR